MVFKYEEFCIKKFENVKISKQKYFDFFFAK